MAAEPYPKGSEPDLTSGRSSVLPKRGTFAPPSDYWVSGEDADIERMLLDEQEPLARLINDAVAILSNANRRQKDKNVVGQRAPKLSFSARITALALTKLRLDTKYPPKKNPSAP